MFCLTTQKNEVTWQQSYKGQLCEVSILAYYWPRDELKFISNLLPNVQLQTKDKATAIRTTKCKVLNVRHIAIIVL